MIFFFVLQVRSHYLDLYLDSGDLSKKSIKKEKIIHKKENPSEEVFSSMDFTSFWSAWILAFSVAIFGVWVRFRSCWPIGLDAGSLTVALYSNDWWLREFLVYIPSRCAILRIFFISSYSRQFLKPADFYLKSASIYFDSWIVSWILRWSIATCKSGREIYERLMKITSSRFLCRKSSRAFCFVQERWRKTTSKSSQLF